MKKVFIVIFVFLAASIIMMSTGAFSNITAERDAEITVVGDASALLGLEPYDGPNGSIVSVEDSGAIALSLDTLGADGVNSRAITVFENVFTIKNNGTKTVLVTIEKVGDNTDAVIFEGMEEGVMLGAGSLHIVSFYIDSTGLAKDDHILEKIIINADANGQADVSYTNPYEPIFTVIGEQYFTPENDAYIYGPVRTSLPFDNVLLFDGDDDYVIVPDMEKYNPTKELTLEAWVKWEVEPSSAESWANIINKSEYQYQLQHSINNKYFEFAVTTTEGRSFVFSETEPEVGQWYHIVATYDSEEGKMKMYVNGVLENTRSKHGDIVVTDDDIYIGKHGWDSNEWTPNYTRHFNGSIAENAIYDNALSAEEIQALYSNYSSMVQD